MDFYLFQSRRGSSILYTEGERIDPQTHGPLPTDFANPMDRFLERLRQRKGRPSKFLHDLITLVRDSYYKLEEKIDPMEHVFKCMRHAKQVNLFYSPRLDESTATRQFESLLSYHRRKHTFWSAVDLFFTILTILLSPILVPLPGPNIFFYYPIARLISHYLARRGALRGLALPERAYTPLPEILEVESLLQSHPARHESDKIAQIALQLRLEHLPHFLGRFS